MAGWIILAIVLFILCGILIVAEILIPSFGLLTLASLACFAGGLVIFHNYQIVTFGIISAVIVIPVTLVIAYRKFPDSKLGKSVFLSAEQRKPGEAVPDSERISSLVGKEGVALSTMRPVGRCEIEEKKYECVAESGYVEKGMKVKVIEVESSQITVRKIIEEE